MVQSPGVPWEAGPSEVHKGAYLLARKYTAEEAYVV